MMKVKYSDSYSAKMKRIQRLPKKQGPAISGLTKRDILQIDQIFHDGIKEDTFHLERLAELTIEGKERKGLPKPTAPLHGVGDESDDRSYMNMMVVTKLANAWKLSPSRKMHHSGKLLLKDLFEIHEHGATIRRKTKKGSVLIKIPPRPALMLAYKRWLIKKRKDKKEHSKEVRTALSAMINDGNSELLDTWGSWVTKLEKKSKELL